MPVRNRDIQNVVDPDYQCLPFDIPWWAVGPPEAVAWPCPPSLSTAPPPGHASSPPPATGPASRPTFKCSARAKKPSAIVFLMENEHEQYMKLLLLQLFLTYAKMNFSRKGENFDFENVRTQSLRILHILYKWYLWESVIEVSTINSWLQKFRIFSNGWECQRSWVSDTALPHELRDFLFTCVSFWHEQSRNSVLKPKVRVNLDIGQAGWLKADLCDAHPRLSSLLPPHQVVRFQAQREILTKKSKLKKVIQLRCGPWGGSLLSNSNGYND